MKRGLVVILCGAALVHGLLSGCASRPRDGLSPQRNDVVLASLSQIGTPYVFGGNEPGRGLDCSGLTQYAHHVAGIQIPRVSTEQIKAARPVSGRPPQPGDMVFFQTEPGQHHVGIMVDAERFVHASTSRRQVRVDRLNTPYWQTRYLGAGTYLD